MNGYWHKRRAAFRYAWSGVKRLFLGEAHAKIHLCAAVVVIVAGLIFHITSTEWCVILLCIGGVFMAEAFNTSIERVCDKVSPEKNPLIKDAKDIAAGAVLLFVLACVVVGLIIFLPKIFDLFFVPY